MALTAEQQQTLVSTNAGTPMGALFRRYWIPALLAEELPEPDCPPVRVRLLGEDLIAFRDTAGRLGLVEGFCPHRGVSLFFARNEECGLRCSYHGWKFDVEGRCVDMPSEPEESNFKHKVRIAAYPLVQLGDVLWAYMGPPGARPAEPEIEWATLPHRRCTSPNASSARTTCKRSKAGSTRATCRSRTASASTTTRCTAARSATRT